MGKALNIVDKLSNTINQLEPGPVTTKFKEKFNSVLEKKNSDYSQMCAIRNTLANCGLQSEEDSNFSDVSYFEYPSITSCDFQSSFSQSVNTALATAGTSRLTIIKLWHVFSSLSFFLRFHLEFNVDLTTSRSILQWDRTLKETGSLIPQTGKHPKEKITEETVGGIRTVFNRSPTGPLGRLVISYRFSNQLFMMFFINDPNYVHTRSSFFTAFSRTIED
ncbi:hypothetical protein ANN_04824 [Periplaneta americana]|uniref:Uncharacterized protein n=1 Tax=Periplaneta americana TaxID=6978 RepID=A0ABQ8T9H7_PERAM|nr:hypothetical protein ANN_04824 [Periplaneta americana]